MRTAAAILLCIILPSQVNALKALATCLSGNELMFSSTGQSPCDVAVELASVCYSATYQISPLRPASGKLYDQGPCKGCDTSCLCNSVYYSLLNACAYCQGGSIFPWSNYTSNCTSISLAIFPQQIPLGVKVPSYAYQNVSDGDRFNVSLASRVKGESSRTLLTPTSSSVAANKPGSPAAVGGVIGGLLGVGLLAALIAFLVLRSKHKSQPESPNKEIGLGTAAPFNHSDKINNPSNMDDPYRQHAPPNPTPQFTGNSSTLNDASLHTMLQNTSGGARGYSGMPEL